MKTITTKLSIVYYSFYLLVIAIYMVFYKLLKDGFECLDRQTIYGMALQYAVILYTIVAVAGGLWFCKKYIDKIRLQSNIEDIYKQYHHIALIRIVLMGVGMLLGIVAFYVLGCYTSMLWCGGICAIALIFCKPTEVRMREELSLNNEKLE